MISKYYKTLGVTNDFSDDAIKERYEQLKKQYQAERFLEGEKGNHAAKMLNEIDVAFNEIMSYRREKSQNGNKAQAYSDVESAIKSGNLNKAQQLLDDFNERSAEWHYLQSVIYYKKNWINESKKQLEIAQSMNPSESKYKTALDKLNVTVNQGAKINSDWNKSGNFNASSSNNDDDNGPENQLGGDSCAQWCCDMIICNTILNCCCSCR